MRCKFPADLAKVICLGSEIVYQGCFPCKGCAVWKGVQGHLWLMVIRSVLQVKLEVFGGIDLHISIPKRSGKRVPSHEALTQISKPNPNSLTAGQGGSSEQQLVAHLSRQQKKK